MAVQISGGESITFCPVDILVVGLGFPRIIFAFLVDEDDVVWWSLGYLTQKVGMRAWISGDVCNTLCTQHIVFWDLT